MKQAIKNLSAIYAIIIAMMFASCSSKIMLIVFFNARMCHRDTLHTVRVAKLSDHSHPFPSGIIKRITCFSQFELFFEPKNGYIFSLLTCKTLTAIVYIILLKVFPIIFL